MVLKYLVFLMLTDQMVWVPRCQEVSNATTSSLWWKSNQILLYNKMKILFWEMFFKLMSFLCSFIILQFCYKGV